MAVGDRAFAAQEFIVRRLAEEPDIGANALYREARALGVATQRSAFLREVRETADFLNIGGRVVQARPGRFARRGADKRSDAAAVLSLARREFGGKIEPARRAFNREHPDRAISQGAVRRHAGSAVEKRGGAWRARPYDRLPRTLTAITTAGPHLLTVKDSRTASVVAAHANAVDAFLSGRADASVLEPFRRTTFRVDGVTYRLETDPERLIRLEEAGELEELQYGT